MSSFLGLSKFLSLREAINYVLWKELQCDKAEATVIRRLLVISHLLNPTDWKAIVSRKLVKPPIVPAFLKPVLWVRKRTKPQSCGGPSLECTETGHLKIWS